jgi:hypothetical protein
MDGLSDEALLAGLASGDPDDAAAFVRRFQSRVYGLALTMLRDPELADDVAQEAFERAWKHAATYSVELAMTSGTRVPLPSFRIDPATGSAGEAIPVDVHRVAAVRLVGRTRGDVLDARLAHDADNDK